jgi:hypothetical protein
MPAAACSLAVDGDSQGFDRAVDASPAPKATATLIINEVAPSGSPDDWFEIYNGTQDAVELSNFRYSDSLDRTPVGFADPRPLAPGEYYVEFLTDDHPGFGLGAEEEIALYSATGNRIDSMQWTEADGIGEGSLARVPDAEGPPTPAEVPTPGYPNQETP